MAWVPLRTSGFSPPQTFSAGVSWDGNNIVGTAAVDDTSGIFMLDLTEIFNLTASSLNVRVTFNSLSMPTAGAGQPFGPAKLVFFDGDSGGTSTTNTFSPYPAAVWGATAVTAFTPSPVEYEITNDNRAFVSFQGITSYSATNATFSVLIELEDPPVNTACFWVAPVGATEDCIP